MKRIPLLLACALGLHGLAGLTACASYGPDGGTRAGDAGFASTDASASADAPLPDGAAPSPATEADYGADDLQGNRSSCLNFVDDDGNGSLDCEDPSCVGAAINTACCVGSTAEACCVERRDMDVLANGVCGTPCLTADGTPLTPRLGQVYEPAALPATCGAPVDQNAFAPIGDATAHGVLALPATYSPATARLVVEGRIGVADDTSELAAAGFGVFTEQGLGAVTRPLVAIVANGSTDEARVIVGDRVVHVEPLLGEACGRSSFYRLALEPTGSFRVSRRTPTGDWEAIGAELTYDVVPAARVAMLGQQPNPEVSGPLAWVSNLVVQQAGCDVLAPARSPAAVVEAGTHDVSGVAIFPENAAGSGYDALVSSGDQLYWMDVRRDTGALTSISADPFAVNFQPTGLWDERFERVEDVDVVLDGAEHRVFLAAGRAGEPLAIYTTTWNAAARELGPIPTMVVAASMFPGAVSVDGPSALVRPEGIALAVRARFADGHTELRLVMLSLAGELASGAPVVARDASGITTDGLLHASQNARPDAFDRDEVADPQLVELDGIVRVLYAGRRGTRWSIGLVVASPDFRYFTPVGAVPVLAPSGAGFDALGVSEPQLVRRDGVDWLYFAGSNGARRGIGLAVQPVVGARP